MTIDNNYTCDISENSINLIGKDIEKEILKTMTKSSNKKTATKKSIKLPNIKWKWNSKKDEQFFEKPTIDSTELRINGKLFTCVLLSIASGFIDLTFFSGLSKSLFHVGTVPLPAAILYTVISIGFILGKFWCATELNVLSELQTRLRENGQFESAKRLLKPKLKWHFGHKFLVLISIVTALSLSVNSIGAGMRNIEQTIKNMSNDANELIELNSSVNQGVQDKRTSQRSNITGNINAQETAKQEVTKAWGRIETYQLELDKIEESDLTDEEKRVKKNELKKAAVSRAPKGVNSSNIDYMTETQLRSIMQAQAQANETLDVSAIYEEGIEYDKQQIEDKIRALAEKEYKDPDGTVIQFLDENNNPINIQTAISRLQGSINKWQAPDAGDAGESSKIFTLVATYLKADATAGGMGVSEWMMLIFIAVAGIVQEFLIALYTPKSTIDRKTLSQYSAYIDFKSIDINQFLISIYNNYLDDGSYDQKKYDYKMEKVLDLIAKKRSNWIENEINLRTRQYEDEYHHTTQKHSEPVVVKTVENKNIDKPTAPILNNGYSGAVDSAINEIEDLLKDD